LDELEDFLNRIDKDEFKLIILFGSLSKGTYTQPSDVDVLYVYDKKFKDLREVSTIIPI
jgi:predicted nucleotidyltransferase